MACIAGEIKPDKEEDWHADSAYRVHLVQACVYKTILKAIGADQLSPELRTAIDRELPRGISSGTQASPWQCHAFTNASYQLYQFQELELFITCCEVLIYRSFRTTRLMKKSGL